MSDDLIWRFTTLIIDLCVFPQSTSVLLVPFHEIKAYIGSLGERIDILFIFDGIYFFVPLECLVLSLSKFIAIRLLLSRNIPIAETLRSCLLIHHSIRQLKLWLHILFVKIITLKLINSLDNIKIRRNWPHTGMLYCFHAYLNFFSPYLYSLIFFRYAYCSLSYFIRLKIPPNSSTSFRCGLLRSNYMLF